MSLVRIPNPFPIHILVTFNQGPPASCALRAIPTAPVATARRSKAPRGGVWVYLEVPQAYLLLQYPASAGVYIGQLNTK